MKRYRFTAALLVLVLLLSVGCGKQQPVDPEEQTQPVTVRLGALKGPTALGMLQLIDENEKGSSRNTYAVTLAAAADELTPLFVRGELDIMAVPTNLAAILRVRLQSMSSSALEKGEPVQVLAANTLGVLSILEKGGESVQSLADLKGKTVYCTGKGAIPEYALRHLLQKAGLNPDKDVALEFKSEPNEVIALLSQTDAAVAMLPQPQVTVAQSKVEGLRIAVDLTEAWRTYEPDSELVQAVLIVRTAFLEAYPEQVEAFLEEYAASAAYVNANPKEAGTLAETYMGLSAGVAAKAIPHCNITCLTGQQMKQAVSGTLQVLYEQDAASVGGALPAAEFYYDEAK